MTARFRFLQAGSRSGSQQIAAAVAIVFASALSVPDAAFAQAASAAAAASAPSDPGAPQFTVHPGQSLNDAAVALTQSHDHTVLARAAKAIFDANPNAFMGHDPSRLRLGAVLNLPAVDSTGAPVGASAAATASATSAAAPAEASAAAANTTAAASAATAASAASAVQPEASAAAETAPASAANTQAGSSPAAATAAPASGTHEFTGAISAPAVSTAPATSAAQPASQAHPQVSSLQQLLALKNRVLMELQKHGIGKQPAPADNTAAAPGGAMPSSGATANAGATAQQTAPSAAAHPANAPAGNPPEYLGIAAAVGAALVALLAGFTMRRRKKAAREQAEADARLEDLAPVESPTHPTQHEPLAEEHHPVAPVAEVEPEAKSAPETFDTASTQAGLAAAASLGADALPHESMDHAREEEHDAEAAEQEHAAREHELNADDLAKSHAVEAEPHTLSLDEAPILASDEPVLDQEIEAAPSASLPATPHDVTLELGPVASTSLPDPVFEQPVESSAPPIQLEQVEPAAQHEQLIEPLPEPASAEAKPDEAAAAPEASPLGAPPPLEPAVPFEFPRDAMRALDSIDDFALPPRTGAASPDASDASEAAPEHRVTQPVVEPEITARQAVPESTPTPFAADEIVAGTAGAAAVAGLGASRFGALTLDFDLDLPASPAQAVPGFTPEELARIARNKLDLASEYIDLGDVVGARTLINEVIESNDVDTRADARALLSTLAPLS